MNKLLLDLWHDLRAKRLWPVAALLAIALVAVPVVLKKKSDNGSASVTPPAASAADTGKAVVVADAATSHNSTLGVFNKKNPFQPDKSVIAKANPVQPSTSNPPSQPSSSSTPPSSTPTTGGGGAGSGSGGTTPTPQVQKPQGPFAYTVDVKFGRRGFPRTHHDVQKLDVLPDQNNPLIVFLGVNAKGDTAVFLTDTSLKAAGEGACKPNADTCSFLYLKLDSSQDTEDLSEQNADGTGIEYTLKLLAIHKVPVSELAKQAKKSARQARIAARRAHVLHKRPATPFRVPGSAQQLPDTVG
jgi:hypothetical protein